MSPETPSSSLADRAAAAEAALAALQEGLRGEVWWSVEARHTSEIAPELPAARESSGSQALMVVRVWDPDERMGSATSRWPGESLGSLLSRAGPSADSPQRPFPSAAQGDDAPSTDLETHASDATGLVDQAWALHAGVAASGPLQALLAQEDRKSVV